MSVGVGRAAERAAAGYLEGQGYVVLGTNWRTRWCEIDIVAQKSGVVYFIEVKYRAQAAWGSGFDYVTPAKLRQMHFAAEFWVARHNHKGDYRLAACELSGNPPMVQAFIDDI